MRLYSSLYAAHSAPEPCIKPVYNTNTEAPLTELKVNVDGQDSLNKEHAPDFKSPVGYWPARVTWVILRLLIRPEGNLPVSKIQIYSCQFDNHQFKLLVTMLEVSLTITRAFNCFFSKLIAR